MATPLLATKLYRPTPRGASVARPRLLARLNSGQPRSLTLLAAPAGSGKTTLLSQWLAEGARPVAWLTLDDEDGEPARFLAYLTAALQRVAPQLGAGVLTALLGPQPPTPAAALATLINELAALPHPVVLVLDDYHRVSSPPVDQAIAQLLAHLPPQLQLVIATREDPQLPLAALRARGQLAELRAADLRFTLAEAAELLNHGLGLDLAPDTVAALERRTEGWAAGLYLAALSLAGREDPAGFLRSFGGSHRFVLDYLLEEVLQQQPAPTRRFLLATAIAERLCGPLCDAILGDEAGAGQATLHAIERANLFLVPLDDERRWYRYHHLFGDLLRQRLQIEAGAQVAGLHARASAWFEANGLAPEALHHAAATGDPERVARLAELAWAGMDGSFQLALWQRWVGQLPAALVRARPVLSTQYAWALLDSGEVEASEARLVDAERWLGGPGDAAGPMVVVAAEQLRTLPARIALARAYLAQIRGEPAAATRHAAAALALSGEAEPLLRAQASALIGLAHWANGELEAAHQALAAWLAHTRQAGNLAFALASVYYLGEIRIAQGQLREAARVYRQHLQLVPPDDAALSLSAAHLHLGLAMLAHEQGDAPTAARHLQTSKELGERASLVDWPSRWCLAQARLQEAAGAWEAALDLLDEAGRLYVRNPVPDQRPVAALKARIYLRQGNLAAAQAWADERALSVADELSVPREFEHMTFARLLIARYGQQRDPGDLRAALDLLARLLAAAEAGGRLGTTLEILLIQSLAHAAGGERGRALAPLERALSLAAPEGYLRLFADEGPPLADLLAASGQARGAEADPLAAYRAALLAAMPRPPGPQPDDAGARLRPAPADALAEPLSEREREVLRLIAEGLSNHELAARLYLSPQTVKVHTRNIYGKLGVSSRTQAVARGRALGLLELP